MFAAGVLENMADSTLGSWRDYTYDSQFVMDMDGLSPTVSTGTGFADTNEDSFGVEFSVDPEESSYRLMEEEKELCFSEETDCFSDICSLDVSDGETGCSRTNAHCDQLESKDLAETLGDADDDAAITDLKVILNLMRDLNEHTSNNETGDGKTSSMSTGGVNTGSMNPKQLLESTSDLLSDLGVYPTEKETRKSITSSDYSTPDSIDPRNTSIKDGLSSKKYEQSISAEESAIDNTAVSSLSTPPMTPILKSSSIGMKSNKKTKRSYLLIDNSFKSSHLDAKNIAGGYSVILKFTHKKKEYIDQVNRACYDLPTRHIITTNELVPISILKMNSKYAMTDLKQKQQLECIRDVPFNLNYVKTLSNSKKDRYYSRLNIFELSRILELDCYDISLTKEIEVNILEIFKNYCNFKLGYQTWIRDTTKQERTNLINKLHSYTHPIYPEFDKFKLEVVVRRGSYSLMQSRLRKERRLRH